MTMYVNDSSGEAEVYDENVFPAELYNVTVNLGHSVTLHTLATDFINEGYH